MFFKGGSEEITIWEKIPLIHFCISYLYQSLIWISPSCNITSSATFKAMGCQVEGNMQEPHELKISLFLAHFLFQV